MRGRSLCGKHGEIKGFAGKHTEGMKAEAYPNISVVICTRDRGSDVARTVTSILQNGYPAYEVLVIGQSRDDSTARCLDAFRHDGRFRYLHSQEVGTLSREKPPEYPKAEEKSSLSPTMTVRSQQIGCKN